MSTPFARRRLRARFVLVGTAVLALVGLTVVPAAFGVATPSLHTVTGKITSPSGGFNYPVPGACVYPFYVPSVVQSSAADYLPTQLLTNTAQCVGQDGRYSVTIPTDLVDNLTVKLLVVVDKTLVSRVVDAPTTAGTLDISMTVKSTSLVDSVPVTNLVTHAPWTNVIGLVTDHATGEVLGAGILTASLTKADTTQHMYAGVALNSAMNIDVHYLLPGAIVTPDVASQFNLAATSATNTVIPEFLVGPLVTASGRVNTQGSSAAKYQVVGANCPDGSCGALGVTNADGTFTFVTTPDTPHDFSIGGQIVRSTLSAGTPILDSTTIVPAGGTATTYGAAPRTWFTAHPTLTLTSSATWAWSGGAFESAPAYWQTAIASSTSTSALGGYVTGADTKSASLSRRIARGTTLCLRANTVTLYSPTGATNVGPYATQCQSSPLDDRALVFTGKWAKSANAKAYAKTLTTSHAAKAAAVLLHATGRSIAIVWARAANGGSFVVTVNGAKVATVSTHGSAAFGKYTVVTTKGFKNAKIAVTALTAAPVSVDGLVAAL